MTALAISLCACGGNAYPSKGISAVIQWGEGGGTDTLMRPLCSIAEKSLGISLNCSNMTGGTGSIATQYVHDAAADGYTLLLGAENAPLYNVLGISELTYDNFTCVYLIGDEQVGIVVSKNSKYGSFTDIVNAALAGEKINMSTTGTGGLPWEVGAFITSVTGASFTQVPYDSDATALNAVMNGECDFTVCKVQSGISFAQSGDIKFLCMFSNKGAQELPDVPSICIEYPEFSKFLPWGPFYGIFVKEGTDASVIKTLTDAFVKAGNDETYQELLANRGVNFLGLSGDEATAYIKNYSTNTITALEEAGAVK